jgi:hypothetical protein
MTRLLLLMLAVASLPVHAAVVLSVGAGKGALDNQPFERVAAIGYVVPFGAGFGIRPEVGGFFDYAPGHQSSFFLAAPLEFRARASDGLFASLAFGSGWLMRPDEVLGGPFQFRFELAAGIFPVKSVGVGVCWGHLSSGWVYPVNHGRDWLMVQGMIPF